MGAAFAAMASVAGLVAATGATKAAPERGPLPLELTAPEGCIDAPTFRERLTALPASPGKTEPPRRVTIVITHQGDLFTGALRVEHASGDTTERQVTSARCDEVSDALTFVAAVALGLDYVPPPPPRPPQPLPASPPPRRPPPPRERDATPAAAEPAVLTGRTRWRFTGAVRGGLLGGAGPSLEPALSVAVGLALDNGGLLAPSFEVSGTWATSGSSTTVAGTTGTLTLLDGALGICPVRVPITHGLALRPCGEAAFGALSGSGTGSSVVGHGSHVEPWMALTPMARAEWQIGKHFMLEIETGPEFQLYRDRFYWSPSGSPLYTVPSVGSLTRLGAVVVWP
jgi:hypothetical protein